LSKKIGQGVGQGSITTASTASRCHTAPQISYSDSLQPNGTFSGNFRDKISTANQPTTRLISGSSRKESMTSDLRWRLAHSADFNVMFANKISSMYSKVITTSPGVNGPNRPDHPEFVTEVQDLSTQRSEELKSLHLEISLKIEEFEFLTEETKEAQEKIKILENNMEIMKETSVKVEKVGASLQRSVEKMSTINMMLIDTLDALELQPSTDEGTLFYYGCCSIHTFYYGCCSLAFLCFWYCYYCL
jgi:hypothetical protein